jgi:hypothetical protein
MLAQNSRAKVNDLPDKQAAFVQLNMQYYGNFMLKVSRRIGINLSSCQGANG